MAVVAQFRNDPGVAVFASGVVRSRQLRQRGAHGSCDAFFRRFPSSRPVQASAGIVFEDFTRPDHGVGEARVCFPDLTVTDEGEKPRRSGCEIVVLGDANGGIDLNFQKFRWLVGVACGQRPRFNRAIGLIVARVSGWAGCVLPVVVKEGA